MEVSGCGEIIKERQRQIDKEGYTMEEDDGHTYKELAKAAHCYLCEYLEIEMEEDPDSDITEIPAPKAWPFETELWNPKGNIRDLIRAGALIAAEIDRRIRSIVLDFLEKGK